MKKVVIATLVLAAFAFAADAPAAFTACKACHGVKADTNINTQNKERIPANLTKAEVEKALHGYKDGTYGGNLKALMKAQTAKLTDDDIKALAEYIGK